YNFFLSYFDSCFRFCSCLFFYQAEDGIRDRHVTGVQTCALPICHLCDAPTPGAAEMTPVPAPPERTGADTAAAGPVTWTPGVRWRSGRVALGGSPWSVTVVPEGDRKSVVQVHREERGQQRRRASK